MLPSTDEKPPAALLVDGAVVVVVLVDGSVRMLVVDAEVEVMLVLVLVLDPRGVVIDSVVVAEFGEHLC